MHKPLILLTNDDGFFSQGIETLYNVMNRVGEVFIVAPDMERSATSMSLTLHDPLRVKNIKEKIYSVSGTPVDCVYMAVQKLLPRKPDLLISGINHGPNLGLQDISYSGTMGGALQGTYLGIQSFAISLMSDSNHKFEFGHGAEIARKIALKILQNDLPQNVTLNVNIPAPPVKGVKVVKLGEKRYNPEIVVNKDPRNRVYYWIGTGTPKATGEDDSDVFVIKNGFVTITPVNRNLTDQDSMVNSEVKNLLGIKNDEIS